MRKHIGIPPEFDTEFLAWFRAGTEASWAALPPSTPNQMLAEYVEKGAGGCMWQSGTRWSDGLSEEALARIELSQHATFPPDYRLFLRHLHVTTLPMVCAGYLEPGMRPENQPDILAAAYLDDFQQFLVLEEGTGFHDWLAETSGSLSTQPASLWRGIQYDVEHHNLWLAEWGPKLPSVEARGQRVRELVETAPRLMRIFGSRYLLAQPCVADNPVFSIYQADVAVYAGNLRDYLLFEFAALLRLSHPRIERTTLETVLARRTEYAAIPFWGALCAM